MTKHSRDETLQPLSTALAAAAASDAALATKQHAESDQVSGLASNSVRKLDLSFSGAGFMGCYYVGVVNCINKFIPRWRINRVAGASAGSLTAAEYVLNLSLEPCLREIISLLESCRSRPLGVFDRTNQIVDRLPQILDKLFPPDAHKICSGRLYVCMTRLKDFKAVIVSEFETRQDLIDALNCSCFIPFWSGNHVSKYKGVKHIDGGFTNNLPAFDEHTIRVCCFAGKSDIAPYDRSQPKWLQGTFKGMPFYLNWANMRRGKNALKPPPPGYIMGLLESGFRDTKEFLLRNDLIFCDKCFIEQQSGAGDGVAKSMLLTPSTSPAASPVMSRAFMRSASRLGGIAEAAEFDEPAPDEREQPAAGAAAPKTRRRRSSLGTMLRQRISRVTSKRAASQHSYGRQTGQLEPVAHSSQDVWLADTEPETSGGEQCISLSSSPTPPPPPSPSPSPSPSPPPPPPPLAPTQQQLPPSIVVQEAHSKDDETPPARPRTFSGLSNQTTGGSESGFCTGDETCSSTGDTSARAPKQSRRQSDIDMAALASATRRHLRRRATEGALLARAQPDKTKLTEEGTFIPSSEGYLARGRRNTRAQLDTSVLFSEKFSLAAEPLPSCPPSPYMNRQCCECVRMRQEARIAEIDLSVISTAQVFQPENQAQKDYKKLNRRLKNPLVWLKSSRNNSYTLSMDED